MFKSSRSPNSRQTPTNWRDYQAGLKPRGPRRPRRPLPWRRIALVLLLIAIVAGMATLLWRALDELGGAVAPATGTAVVSPPAASPDDETAFDRERLRQFLDLRAFAALREREFPLKVDGRPFKVTTTLDPGLQRFLLDTIDRVNSRHVGIVVMAADSGRVLALAGYDRTDPRRNPCLLSEFPAASIFKIVTAASAIDQCGYSADTPMPYSGPKHTLYKRQLTDRVDRYTTTIPLREAFADSVNPVFGKLGVLRLRKPQLTRAAVTFGFNQPLDFELPLPPSQFRIGDEPYNWAEVASGFNLDTTLSPLHGAALATAVINGGRMVAPSIIEQIDDTNGHEYYRHQPPPEIPPIMSTRAANALVQMMEETIASGTARKLFRRHQRDNVLSRLQLGGKTGSIDSADHDLRYDWFVGFARERRSGEAVVVSVLVAHEKYIGIRAGDYARRAITHHFGTRGE